MADVSFTSTFKGTSPSQGLVKLPIDFHFDDVANTIVITASFSKNDDTPCPDPQFALLTIVLNTSVNATIDLLTGKITAPAQLAGQDFSQASPGEILNGGSKTRTGVTLRVSANRAAALSFGLDWKPPA
jgi:hypothetical protein